MESPQRGLQIPEHYNWGTLEGICPDTSCHRGGSSPGVTLAWVTQGRARPGARAYPSLPSASPLRELPISSPPQPRPPQELPLPASPASGPLLEAHPPPGLSWEKGSQHSVGLRRAGLWPAEQPSHILHLLGRRGPGGEEVQPSDCREDPPRRTGSPAGRKREEDLEKGGQQEL